MLIFKIEIRLNIQWGRGVTINVKMSHIIVYWLDKHIPIENVMIFNKN